MEFRQARQNHPGIESAIGALQAGNGQERCRDKSKLGYERYVGLGILGRNLQMLGKLLLAQDDAKCEAAKSRRKRRPVDQLDARTGPAPFRAPSGENDRPGSPEPGVRWRWRVGTSPISRTTAVSNTQGAGGPLEKEAIPDGH